MDLWLALAHASVERDLVWGGSIDSSTRGKPMSKEGIDKIEREVNDFHSERMNSPPQMSSLQYWAQASLKCPTGAQPSGNAFASSQVALHQSATSPNRAHC